MICLQDWTEPETMAKSISENHESLKNTGILNDDYKPAVA